MFHRTRGLQYTSGELSQLLTKYNITAPISSDVAYLNNAIIEHFFGNLKSRQLLTLVHLRREIIKEDMEEYSRYYNNERRLTMLDHLTPTNEDKI